MVIIGIDDQGLNCFKHKLPNISRDVLKCNISCYNVTMYSQASICGVLISATFKSKNVEVLKYLIFLGPLSKISSCPPPLHLGER